MAVVHLHEPGKYLLGIECDGATYHSLSTARERDRLRQFVLEELGWKLASDMDNGLVEQSRTGNREIGTVY